MAVYRLELILVGHYFLGIYASYHWKVTEGGKISSQGSNICLKMRLSDVLLFTPSYLSKRVENSGFPLTRQDDMFALLEQEQRLKTVSKLYEQLMSLKRSIDIQWAKIEQEGDIEKRLYSSDIDCLIGEVPLSQYNLNTEFLDYGQGSRPKMKRLYEGYEPDCTAYSKLDFSMRTFPHLETLSRQNNFNLSKNPVPSRNKIDYDIDAMLRHNNSDWTAYNIASLYWRTMGNGTSALECAKRALYFSPRKQRYIVLLNLGTLLQELESLGEAAIVLHSAVDHDPVQDVSHLALGNVYAALGDYKRSLACYENVLSLNPNNVRALQLKHALLCHKKLESGLLAIHEYLQKILNDLQAHNALHEEWLRLQNQVNWERNSKVKEFFSLSQPIYVNLQMLLQNVEHQAKTLNDEVSRIVPRPRGWRGSMTDGGEHRNLERGASWRGGEKGGGAGDEETREVREAEEGESGLETYVSSPYMLQNKMGSLISLVKSRYEAQINLAEMKRKSGEGFFFLNRRNQFSFDKPFWVSDMETCAQEPNSVRKLN